jgi:Ca2+-binding RTX toxin-like protein
MATANISQGFSMLTPQDWLWEVTSASSNRIIISDGRNTQIFTGSFTFTAAGSVNGTVTSTEYRINNDRIYTVTGMADSAARLADFAFTFGDTQETYAYVLRGNDVVNGSISNDTLLGYNGNDRLVGGRGKDVLTGGSGNDIFDFNALNEMGLGSARDVVTDFVRGRDKIDLSTIDARSDLPGNQPFSFVSTFSGAGQVRYSSGIVSINTDADATAEYQIQLTGSAPNALAASDFVL